MKTKQIPHSLSEFSRRRDVLRGLGLAGLSLALGPACTTGSGFTAQGADLASAVGADRGVPSPDAIVASSPDVGGLGADASSGLPPMDLVQPKVTQTATFALG